MANRKYLFFCEVAKQLGLKDLAKLFRDTPAQETEHAFAHFRLLHPELVVGRQLLINHAKPTQDNSINDLVQRLLQMQPLQL